MIFSRRGKAISRQLSIGSIKQPFGRFSLIVRNHLNQKGAFENGTASSMFGTRSDMWGFRSASTRQNVCEDELDKYCNLPSNLNCTFSLVSTGQVRLVNSLTAKTNAIIFSTLHEDGRLYPCVRASEDGNRLPISFQQSNQGFQAKSHLSSSIRGIPSHECDLYILPLDSYGQQRRRRRFTSHTCRWEVR